MSESGTAAVEAQAASARAVIARLAGESLKTSWAVIYSHEPHRTFTVLHHSSVNPAVIQELREQAVLALERFTYGFQLEVRAANVRSL